MLIRAVKQKHCGSWLTALCCNRSMPPQNTAERLRTDPAEWDRIAATRPGSVLLRSGRPDAESARSYLFTDPLAVLCARKADEIPRVFEEVERALQAGHSVAGFLSYEAGYHFEPAALKPDPCPPASSVPLAWFGVYAEPLIVDGALAQYAGGEAGDAGALEELAFDLTREEYRRRVERIRQYIEAGDLYQANLTMRIRQAWNGDAAELFARMMANQPVPYGALVHTGEMHILSASPELFFRRQGSEILVRPMKGTARRGRDGEEDAEAAAGLAADEKNRAENLMIVDLLRNDLGRLCTMGSIRVTELFRVERYPDLFQMTSSIRGELSPGVSCYEIFRSLFPCGSITGAPKIRTMQVVRELEGEARGIGCGAIGFFSPRGDAVFSVAIRTLALHEGTLEMRVGSGITYDSDPDAEFEECRLKAQFLARTPVRFDLIETLLWDGEFFLLDLHLDRLAASADYFDFSFDRNVAEEQLRWYADRLEAGCRFRVRLLLSRSGSLSLTSEPLAPQPEEASIVIAGERTDSADRFLRHKTTRRALYDRVYANCRARGFDDALFLNERGEVTEGAIHNMMIEKNGRLTTPSLRCGLLPGVYRRHLLETRPEIQEGVVTLDDVLAADKVFVFNSVRGLRRVRSIEQQT